MTSARTEPSVEALRDALVATLTAGADPKRAAQEKAYMKSALAFLGVGVPAVRASELDGLAGIARDTARWAHVDWLSTGVLSPFFYRVPAALEVVPRWAVDASFWVRRAALLSQLTAFSRGEGDFGLFARTATPLLSAKEFFMRKAISWVLRTASKKRPELVRAYVAEHGEARSVTRREAVKYL